MSDARIEAAEKVLREINGLEDDGEWEHSTAVSVVVAIEAVERGLADQLAAALAVLVDGVHEQYDTTSAHYPLASQLRAAFDLLARFHETQAARGEFCADPGKRERGEMTACNCCNEATSGTCWRHPWRSVGGRCGYGEMEWCCALPHGHEGPHESAPIAAARVFPQPQEGK